MARAVIYGITLNNANLVTSAKILFNCVKMSLKTVIYKYCFIIFGFLFMEKERLCLNGALEQLVLHGQIVRSPKFFYWWNIFVSQCQYFYSEYLLGMLYLSVYKNRLIMPLWIIMIIIFLLSASQNGITNKHASCIHCKLKYLLVARWWNLKDIIGATSLQDWHVQWKCNEMLRFIVIFVVICVVIFVAVVVKLKGS